jgi:hypothetical protein
MMTRLPHGDEAILDIRKIEDYCMSPSHPRGRHKARVFREALDLQRSTPRGCETLCLKPHTPARPPRLRWTSGGRIGASMRPSGDKEKVLW